MYENETGLKPTALKEDKVPELRTLTNQIARQNREQYDMIANIKEKLGSIYHWEMEKEPASDKPSAEPRHIIDELSEELSRMQRNSLYLEQTYRHIQKII